MLEFEIAALYYFIAGILNLPAYFVNITMTTVKIEKLRNIG